MAQPMGSYEPLSVPSITRNSELFIDMKIDSGYLQSAVKSLQSVEPKGELLDGQLRMAFIKATLLNAQGKRKEARRYYLKVGESRANSLEGRASLLAVRVIDGVDVQNDLTQLKVLVDAHPDEPFVRWTLADLAYVGGPWIDTELNRWRAGIAANQYAALREIWKPGPEYFELRQASQLAVTDKIDQALELWRKKIQAEPTAANYLLYAATLNRAGLYEQADEYYEKATSMQRLPRGLYSWGVSLEERGEVERGQDLRKQALRMMMEDGDVPRNFDINAFVEDRARMNHNPRPSPDGLHYWGRSPYRTF